MSDLLKQINIGKDTAGKLKQLGIETFEDLVAAGSEQAFLRIQTIDPGACIQLLYGLEGAIEGVKGNQLPAHKKQELLEFYRMAKQKR